MILLDTMVLSELSKARPNAGVVTYLKTQALDTVFLSAMTIGEIEAGIQKQRSIAPAFAEALSPSAIADWPLAMERLPSAMAP